MTIGAGEKRRKYKWRWGLNEYVSKMVRCPINLAPPFVMPSGVILGTVGTQGRKIQGAVSVYFLCVLSLIRNYTSGNTKDVTNTDNN